MVPLVAVRSEFAGRVLVAKLGSAGIIAELRGVSRVYPTVLDAPEVWVEATELSDARALITADTDDELAAGPAPPGAPPLTPAPHRRGPVRPVVAAVALALLLAISFGSRACTPLGGTTSAHAH